MIRLRSIGAALFHRADPFFIFLIIAAAILLYSLAFDAPQTQETVSYRIDITPARAASLQAAWTQQKGAPPSSQELKALIAEFVEEEIFFREALRLGLDENDTIVRRRLAQKMAFILAGQEDAAPPRDEDLRKYYQDNIDRYTAPETFSFRQIFFSDARRDDPLRDAQDALLRLQQGADGDMRADPSMAPYAFQSANADIIAGWFGTAFAQQIRTVQQGVWVGPIRSAYGVHLIYLEEKTLAQTPSFEAVRERVASDYKAARRVSQQEQAKASIIDRYEVHLAPELMSATGPGFVPEFEGETGAETMDDGKGPQP